MCADYWTLADVAFRCPNCKAKTKDDLQTHFMGNDSCLNVYRLRQPIPELAGIRAATLGDPAQGHPDDFTGFCPECNTFLDFAAEIVNGVVVKAWPYRVVA